MPLVHIGSAAIVLGLVRVDGDLPTQVHLHAAGSKSIASVCRNNIVSLEHR